MLQKRLDEMSRGDRFTERIEKLVKAMKAAEERSWNIESER